MKQRIASSGVLIVMLFLLCSWGDKGHQKIDSSTAQFFPAGLANYKDWSAQLTEHGSDADNRKRYDPTEGIKHYIDIDAYAGFMDDHKIVEEKSAAFTKYGREFMMKNGTLPWVTDSTYSALVAQFKAKEWSKAVLTAADLGHYVGDGHMPLHITSNFDGKLTGQNGIHSRYESKMINRYVDSIRVNISGIHQVNNVRRYIFQYIYDNYQYKDSLLIADKVAFEKADHQYNDLYYQLLWKLTRGFTEKMIADSSKSLAELIIQAWTEAGKPNLPADFPVEKILEK